MRSGPALVITPALALLAACGHPAPAVLAEEPAGDAGASVQWLAESELGGIARPAADLTLRSPEIGAAIPAPPSASRIDDCRLDVPSGACDRCPDRACRQVRLSLYEPPSESPWAMFCEEGDVAEEALIACRCAGGELAYCALAARDTVQALAILENVFEGSVPPVGTRYRDSSGLRATVDEELHDWLAGVAAPALTLRCDVPDREAAAQRYAEESQRVRMTGSCF